MYVRKYICMYVYMYVRKYVRMYIIYVCMCVRVRIVAVTYTNSKMIAENNLHRSLFRKYDSRKWQSLCFVVTSDMYEATKFTNSCTWLQFFFEELVHKYFDDMFLDIMSHIFLSTYFLLQQATIERLKNSV